MESVARTADGQKEKVTVEFDWEKQFLPGQDLSDTPVSYSRQDVPEQRQTGVLLFIEKARDAWTIGEINDLQRDLLGLQTPFPDLITKPTSQGDEGAVADPGFAFKLVVEGSHEIDEFSSGLEERFFNAAWAKLDGTIDATGEARYDITLLRTDESETFVDHENRYKGLEGASFRVYFMVYSSDYFKDSVFTVREAQRKGRSSGGVRIYLDGFRVFPYGDEGDDWLRLDWYAAKNIDIAKDISPAKPLREFAKRLSGRPFLFIPKNQQVFGAVALSQLKHTAVGTNISRERLIETPTVTLLRRFVQNGMYWMTLKYAAFVASQKESAKLRKPQTVAEIIGYAQAALQELPNVNELSRKAIIEIMEKAAQQARMQEEEHISEISMLRILASAGTTIIIMNHQLQALLGAVLETQGELVHLRSEIPEAVHERYDDIIERVSDWHQMVKLQVSQLGFLLSPESRKSRKRQVLRAVVENVKKAMSYYMVKNHVDFENNVPPSLHTPPIYLSELYAVLINILSNALKAVHGRTERSIAVEADRKDGILSIRMKDTGVGLDPVHRESSFKPFVTTSLPNPVLGIGTGLGLTVVRDILELYAGKARFIDIDLPWKTCIEIVLPERRTLDGI